MASLTARSLNLDVPDEKAVLIMLVRIAKVYGFPKFVIIREESCRNSIRCCAGPEALLWRYSKSLPPGLNVVPTLVSAEESSRMVPFLYYKLGIRKQLLARNTLSIRSRILRPAHPKFSIASTSRSSIEALPQISAVKSDRLRRICCLSMSADIEVRASPARMRYRPFLCKGIPMGLDGTWNTRTRPSG